MERIKQMIRNELYKRRKIHLYLGTIILISIFLMWLMMKTQPFFLAHTMIFDTFEQVAEGTARGKAWSFLQWYIGEWAEPQVFRMVPAAVLSCITAFIGWHLEKKGSRWRGSDTVGGTGLFVPIFVMDIVSLLVCDLFYYKDAQYGFMPTFIPMACVVVALTLEYGCDWKKYITIVLLTGTVPYLIARYAVFYLMDPFGFPRPVGGWIGMIGGTIFSWKVAGYLPWMTKRTGTEVSYARVEQISDGHLYIERILADPSELICWGSSWNSIGMYVGGIVGWMINPYSSSCKEGMIPVIIFSQIITLALGNYIFFPAVKDKKMPYVFTGYVPISCFINNYISSAEWIGISIAISAVVPPLLTKWMEMKIIFLKKWPIAVTCILSMIIYTLGWSLVLQKIGY